MRILFSLKLNFFDKQCGVVTDRDMKHSLINIYKYAIYKEAIQEAIIVSCSRHQTKTYGNQTMSIYGFWD